MKTFKFLFLLIVAFWFPSGMWAQQQIMGVVTDAKQNEPLIGVTIMEKGTNNGTVTDLDGKFSLRVGEQATLTISYVGYVAQEVSVKDKSTVSVQLKESSEILSDVVVVGYGIQKKATLSGAVTSVRGDELLKAPVTNVSQSIAGRLPGVFAVSNTAEPGYDGTTIRIRGVNTFGNANPLIVVDGVPGRSLERIDPATIETMSVLKDASAAIYGAQAANGVILITTKRGRQGTPSVGLNFNYGISRPSRLPKMSNAAEYATLLNEIDTYAGGKPRYTADDIELFGNGSDPWGHPDTDWFKETLKSWSPQTNVNVTVDGGSDHIKYFVSATTKFQDAFYRHSGSNYHQHDLKANLDIKVSRYVDLFTNLLLRMEEKKYPTRSSENIFRMIMRSKPTSPAYWPDGTPGPDVEFGDNPVVICTDATGYDRDKIYTFDGDFGLNIKMPWVEGLSLKGTASIDKTNRFRKIWQTPWYLYSWDGTSYDEAGSPILVKGKKGFTDPRLNEYSADNLGTMLSAFVNYNRVFNEMHDVTAMAGVERIYNHGDSFQAYRRYFLSSTIDQLFAGGKDEINNDGTGYREARLNYFGRLNYAYKQKYLAEFVWRYQGSYIFDEHHKWGFFPGVSLGYVLSEENFWHQTLPIISFAKLRASWGQTGNDLIAPFQYLSSYSFRNITFMTGNGDTYNQAMVEGVTANHNVTWETATQTNVGVDLQFLKGDLNVTVDYFHNKRSDILWRRNASVPATSGLTLPDENIGKVVNQGVDFDVNYHKKLNELTLGAGFNGVYATNKILFWDETPDAPDWQKSTGRPIGSDLYYQAIGIYKTQEEIDGSPHWPGARPGDIKFADYNDDKVIDGNDRVRNDKSRIPKFTYGINLNASYRGFDLSMLFQGSMGGVFYETTESGDFANFLKSFYDKRWTVENPSTTFPRTYNRSNEYWVNQRNTFWLHNSNYIRLKTFELGYSLPAGLVKAVGMNRVRLYISGYNLLTYAPDMKDYDPENTSGAGYNYPLNKIVNFGINVNF